MSENTSSRTASTLVSSLVVAAAVLAMFLVGSAPAWAAEEHAFDAVLSLRGDCSTETLDMVPDPGTCPGVAGVDHPQKTLSKPCGTAVDSYGDIYVASPEVGLGNGTEGRIDIFNPQGDYLKEIADEHQPCDLAVDSQGNLFTREFSPVPAVSVLTPTSYPPQAGTTYTHAVLHEQGEFCGHSPEGIAVDPSNDHLLIAWGCTIAEYESFTNGSTLIPGREKIGIGLGEAFGGIGVCGTNHDVMVAGTPFGLTSQERANRENTRIFVFDGVDGHKKLEIDGKGESDADPEGGFGFTVGSAAIAVDQTGCDFYIGDITERNVVDQFGAEGHFIGQLRHSLSDAGRPYFADLAVDDPYPGQTNYNSPNEGEVYIAQGENNSTSHLYSFRPGSVGPPEIESQTANGISETEAVLRAQLNPHGLHTQYHFEYISQAAYEADGGKYGAGMVNLPVPEADVEAETSFAPVSEPVTGLAPGTAYRFRLVASNCAAPEAILGECLTVGEGKPGEEGKDAIFVTYVAASGLPDGRGYELVSPPDTNGLIPTMAALGENSNGNFDTLLASPDGRSVLFGAEGGSLPSLGGGGFHDTYEAVRDESGWQSHFAGVDGTEAERPNAGGISADHGYSFWTVEDEGRASLPKGNYLRLPDGSFQPVGLGSLGQDLTAGGDWIATGAGHVIFHTGGVAVKPETLQLEPNAPPTGTAAVYDRAPSGPTHVVSLLPEGVTPEDEHDSFFQGASTSGMAIVFKTQSVPGEDEVKAPLYVRLDNAKTIEIESGETIFGGISRHGERLVYLKPNPSEPQRPNPIVPAAEDFPQGDIFSYDTATETTTPIGFGEKSVLVNVSPDGSHIYFDSTEVLDNAEEGVEGKDNLYVWNAAIGSIRLVAGLTAADIFGTLAPNASVGMTDGLGLWVDDAVASPKRGTSMGSGPDPSRSSADGSVLIFESHAKLTTYENGDRAEIYRYDEAATAGEQIECLSCNPTGEAAQSDARLQTLPAGLLEVLPPVNSLAAVPNLSPDGKRAFFETGDPLVAGDIDGKVDVYEWEAQGTGSCGRVGGCVSLISSGHSATDNYLYAASADGSDVFFETGDLLVPEDHDSTLSIYDAREGGGPPEQPTPPGECLGEACQPGAVAPNDATPASSSFEGPGNPAPKRSRRCPKGKIRVRHAGKAHCASRHRGKRHGHKRTRARRVSR